MSTPTTQAASTPAASAAGDTVVASSATTGSFSTSTSVVTSTVTTPSSPKRTMSLGDYKKTRGNMELARDELEAIFVVGSDADMEDGEEEDEGTSSSTHVDPSVGSRRPREAASSSKLLRSGSDRPLVDAGPLPSPRSGGAATSSNTVVSRTGTVCDPWMPTPSEIQSRFGSTAPPIHSDGTGIRRLPVGAECPNSRHSVKAGVPLLKPLTKTTLATVSAFSQHVNAMSASPSAPRLTDCTGVQSKRELKTLRTNLIAQMSSSTVGGRSTLSRGVGDYSSRSSFTPFGGFGGGGLRTPSPFPERPASGRSVAPSYRGPEEILSNEYENDPDLGSGSDDQQFGGRSSELSPVRLAVGVAVAGRRRGSGPPDFVDRLEAV
ncbi:unnamed protein product [Phytophthora fragariaefolia]|uniref:Unnamed protein product n=1 Tax=Phytophthora fragariaefolia TaxID=1490495 RepID=A0A9W7D137_9STRA|nr:unnamed protein product [Phytophthora fragariaefolia]